MPWYKVHIFWEGHKILRNLPLYVLQSKVMWRFRKICGLLRMYELYGMYLLIHTSLVINSNIAYRTLFKHLLTGSNSETTNLLRWPDFVQFHSYFFGDKFKYCLSNPTQTLAHWIEYPIRKLRIFSDDLILYNFIHSYFFGDKFKYPLSKLYTMIL